MKNPVNTKIPVSIFVFGSILLAYLLLYLPITNLLNESLIEKWRLSAQAEAYSIQLTLQQGIEGGNSLSSRSAIRDKLLEYKNGQITWQELQTFSEQKYVDGASVLKNVVFAYRFVEDQILVKYITPGKETLFDEIQNMSLYMTQNQIFHLEDKTYLLVISNIQYDGSHLGQDIILYDISPMVDNFSSDRIAIELFPITSESADLQEKNHGALIVYEEKLPNVNAHIRICTDRQTILGNAGGNTHLYLALYIISLLALFALSNYIFIHQTRVVINKIEDRKQNFKNLAYQDALTSAYSRQYFLDWQKRHHDQNNHYILVMIDIDKLKTINDTYGHKTGDLVLQTVVHTIQDNLRTDDIVIRYGGDEFLVLFRNISIETAHQIMNRVEIELGQTDVQSINIEISYGITKIDNIKTIDEAIKQADAKMYQGKNDKNDV